MFKWLFGNKKQVVNEKCEDVVEEVMLPPKRTFFDYMLDNKTFKDWYYDEWVWSAGKTTAAELVLGHKSKQYCREHREKLKEQMSRLPEPMYHVFQNGHIYVFEGSYTRLSYLNGDYWLSDFTIRPPVMRMLKDIDSNFCDWNYTRYSEYDYKNPTKLVEDRQKIIEGYQSHNFNYKLEKNNILVEYSHSVAVNHYALQVIDYFGNARITFNEEQVDIREEEALILHSIFKQRFSSIEYEENEEIKRKDAEKRALLDAEIAKAL